MTADARRARRARCCAAASALDRAGFFFAPTVLADVPADAELMREEPFGPIAAINRFTDARRRRSREANATEYAFAAYVFTDSLRTARARARRRCARRTSASTRWRPSLPDAPLGGMQASGVGYEGGRDGIAAFQHLRLDQRDGVSTSAPHPPIDRE